MKRFLTRVGYALQGWKQFFANETHGQIQAAVAAMVIAAGLWLGISRLEWLAVLLCIGMVLAAEMVNTALEKLADHLHPGQHARIGLVKDVAAGAVLWLSVVAVVVGALVFWPYLAALLA